MFSAVFAAFFSCVSFAETIELKDGKRIVGEVVRETDQTIVISKHDGGFIFAISRDRVANIRESTPEEMKAEAIKRAPPVSGVVQGEDEKKKKGEAEKYRLEMYEKEVLAAKRARGKIKIKFANDRFGVVDATLNGKVKATLLVDTGASLVVITREIANKLGLTEDDEKGKLALVLANGNITTAAAVTLDSVQVGSSAVNKVDAAVSKTSPGNNLDGLLGMTYLEHFHVKLDAKENCLVLEKY